METNNEDNTIGDITYVSFNQNVTNINIATSKGFFIASLNPLEITVAKCK